LLSLSLELVSAIVVATAVAVAVAARSFRCRREGWQAKSDLAPVQLSVPADLEGLPGVLGGAPGRGGVPSGKPLHDPRRLGPGVQECRDASEGTVSRPEEHSRLGGPANDIRAGPETDAPILIILEKNNNYWVFKQWTYKRFFNNNDISKEDNL